MSGGEYIEIDIVRKDFLNPDGYNWKDLLDAYRGRNNANKGYINQRWVKQPDKWIVYDPHGYLKKSSDPKNNPIFDNIMQGFRAIQEYTNGFIQAPSKDEVEIRYKEERTPDGAISFKITDGEAFAFEEENSNDEIIRSGVGAGPYAFYDPMGELVSSVSRGR